MTKSIEERVVEGNPISSSRSYRMSWTLLSISWTANSMIPQGRCRRRDDRETEAEIMRKLERISKSLLDLVQPVR